MANPTVGGVGYSEVLVLEVSVPPGPPVPLFGLTSFNLTGALGLGLLCAAVLWRVQKKKLEL